MRKYATAPFTAASFALDPDPDPVTAEIDDRAMAPEQPAEPKTKHVDALRKRRTNRGSDDAVLGG